MTGCVELVELVELFVALGVVVFLGAAGTLLLLGADLLASGTAAGGATGFTIGLAYAGGITTGTGLTFIMDFTLTNPTPN